MAIKWRVEQETFMDKVEIARVEKAVALLKLGNVTAIDSYSMSPNGPILSSIFLLGEGFLAEVVMGGKHLSFDVCPSRLLVNYRITYGEYDPRADAVAVATAAAAALAAAAEAPGEKDAEARATITKFVTVTLRHTDILSTVMNYFGEDVESWLEFVLDVFPPKLALSEYSQAK